MSRTASTTNRRQGHASCAWFFPLLLGILGLACTEDLPGSCPRGRPIHTVRAVDAQTVEVSFACRVDEGSASDPASFLVASYSLTPPAPLALEGSSARGGLVTLRTAPQVGLVTYTMHLRGLRDADGNELQGSANFLGAGPVDTAPVTLEVDDRYNARLTQVHVIVSVDSQSGVFSHAGSRLALADADGDHRFQVVQPVQIDPGRTIDLADDRMGARFMAYTARAVDEADRPLSELHLFEVTGPGPITVLIPLLTVPPPPPPEGLVDVAFTVDDRPARALAAPALRVSIDSEGRFDPEYATTVDLSDTDGDHLWTGTARVRIAPARIPGGATADTRPYSAFLVEGGAPYSARSVDFVAPDESPVTATILVGNKDKMPVTFRVDVAQAWLDPEGTAKGLYPGEAIFLTGEFGTAEDAFGQNASDAFSGGENPVLQMSERADRPGVWERTLFLPPGRPYGWKVVRCPRDKGCTQLNKMVTSTGRAFPTVMKNLVTELCDAGKTTWTDPQCQSPRLADPRNLSAVPTGSGGVLDYSGAKIYVGTGQGLADQKDPPGTPQPALLFKQEVPDLVADVKDQPLQTPVYVIGSWRDVNIPGSPADLIGGGTVIDLAPTDYDAGLIGLPPPSYDLPPPSKPSPFKMDGQLEGTATLLAGGSGTMPLYLALSGNHLYLATDDAGEGSDNIILVSATAPGGLRPAPWGKAGQVALGGKTVFLADENDSNYAGCFELGPPDQLIAAQGGNQSTACSVATPAAGGGVLEGTLDLVALFGNIPAVVHLAVAPWASADGGSLYSSAQTPPTKDGNGNIEASEILKVSLPDLKVLP